MTITVKLFAIYREVFGKSQVQLSLEEGVTVGEVLESIIISYPELHHWKGVTRFGVNCQFVTENYGLQEGDELVLIPPVSGG